MKRYSVTVEGTDYDATSYKSACARFRAEQKAGARNLRLWDWSGERGLILAEVENGVTLRPLNERRRV